MSGSDIAQLIIALIGLIGTFGGIWYTNRLQTQSAAAMHKFVTTETSQQKPSPISPPATTAPSNSPTGINKGAVLRDVGILVTVNALVGFLVGLISSDGDSALSILGVVNIIMFPIAFTVMGVKAGNVRWKHLLAVAIGVWLTSIVNFVFLPGYSVSLWLFGLVLMLVFVGIGGALSYLFSRERKTMQSFG